MNRISPTDPPDEPVNRIAGVLAEMEAKADATLGLFPTQKMHEEAMESLAPMREAFAALLELYRTDPKGDHRDAAVQFAKQHHVSPSSCIIVLRPMARAPFAPFGEVMVKVFFFRPEDFTSHHAAIIERIIRDLEKSDDGFWTAS